MDKKWIFILIIVIASFLVIGGVSAAKMTNKDFDGYFTMKVPKDVSFQKQDSSIDENGFKMDSVIYGSENLVIIYMDSPAYSENSSAFLFQTMFESMYPDLDKCYESQDDGLKIFQPVSIDETHYPIVTSSSGNEMVMIVGPDLNTLKDMGHSIDFS